MQTIQQEIKELIIQTLNLEDMSPEDIDTDAPLFGEGLGLDSIDALELGLALKKQYQLAIPADSNASRAHFYSVATLAKWVQESPKAE